MSAQKCLQLVNKVTQPLVNVVLKVESRAIRKTATVDAALAAQIALHDAAGTDAAQASSRRFVAEQKQLLSYRVARAFAEGRYIFSGEYCKNYDYKAFIIDLRTVTRIIILYLLGYIFGRGSIFTPITPDSPFVLALETKPNPYY